MKIGVVIPILNEAVCLLQQREYYTQLRDHVDLVFVDGGSVDHSVFIASEFGEVIRAPRGRAVQKNAGARHLKTDIIIFLHVDTQIAMDVLMSIRQSIAQGVDAGCFTMKVSGSNFIVHQCASVVNWRAKYLKVLDGDLGLYVRRDVFTRLHGFDDVPKMEDIFFGDKLKKYDYTIKVLDQIIEVSSRKWIKTGFLKTFLGYTWIYIQYWLGLIKPGRAV